MTRMETTARRPSRAHLTLLLLFLVTSPHSLLPITCCHALSSSSSKPPQLDPLSSNSNVFPVSTRQALAQKSLQINSGSRSSSASSGQYSPAGWSNRAAVALTPVHPAGVYTADRPFYWNTIDVSCRCTIIELPPPALDNKKKGGPVDLWVHSPVALDGPLRQALQQVNDGEATVKYVVSPNYEHLKFAPEWQRAFPEAQMIACPGLAERMPQVSFASEIPAHYRPPSWTGQQGEETTTAAAAAGQNDIIVNTDHASIPWDTDILEALHVDCERNPFTGQAFFNEVVYYHKPSKTCIVTDLFWNYPATDAVPNSQYGRDDSWELAPGPPAVATVPFKSRLWKFGMDQVYAPFFNTFMVTDANVYKAIAHHIVHVWDVELLIPAHGDLLRGKDFIRTVLTQHFGL